MYRLCNTVENGSSIPLILLVPNKLHLIAPRGDNLHRPVCGTVIDIDQVQRQPQSSHSFMKFGENFFFIKNRDYYVNHPGIIFFRHSCPFNQESAFL